MSFLQMSITGAVLIAVIIGIRTLLLHRLPKKTFLLLWMIALLRLLLPVSFPFAWHIAPLAVMRPVPVQSSEFLTASLPMTDQPPAAADVMASGAFSVPVREILWGIGVLVCAAFFAVTYFRCRREFDCSLPLENSFTQKWLSSHRLMRPLSIRQSDRIDAPLTFGILRPVILMPKSTDWCDEKTLSYVLAHEFVHIRRFDAVAKLLLVLALCLHWFNPLVWAMVFLANRDIELSCDEAVIRQFGESSKADYARALLCMEERRCGFAPLFSNFSKNPIEERIEMIMKLKKTTSLSLVLAAFLVAGAITVFAVSPEADPMEEGTLSYGGADILSYTDSEDGKQYYSWDNGETYVPLTEEEFQEKFPTPNIEWWTYEEYKRWLEQEKQDLRHVIGQKGWANGKAFVWTQEEVDKAIAMYEETLEEIKNGVMHSKTVDGDPNLAISYDPKSSDVKTGYMASFIMRDNKERVFGPYETKEELRDELVSFCSEQLALGAMNRQEADVLLKSVE